MPTDPWGDTSGSSSSLRTPPSVPTIYGPSNTEQNPYQNPYAPLSGTDSGTAIPYNGPPGNVVSVQPKGYLDLFGLTPANDPNRKVQPGPWTTGYVTQDQAAIANAFGLDKNFLDLWNTIYGYQSGAMAGQQQGIQYDTDQLKRMQDLQRQHYNDLADSLRNAYGIDVGRLDLQKGLNKRQKKSLEEQLWIATQMADNNYANLQGHYNTTDELYKLYVEGQNAKLGSLGKLQGIIGEDYQYGTGSATTAKGYADKLAAIQEAAQQRGILHDTVARGAGISGETGNRFTDLANNAQIGRDTRNLNLADRLHQLKSQYDQGMLSIEDQRAAINNAIKSAGVKNKQDLADIINAEKNNRLGLQDTQRQNTDAMYANAAQAAGLDLDAKQLEQQLTDGLKKIGFDKQMSAIDIARAINGNDMKAKQLAQEIMQAALQAALQYVQ